ncbi:MAG: hypothetical protein EXX96DRAFT_570547, partial [Benjaminiella poitrasii]
MVDANFYLYHPTACFSRLHAIHCLHMHQHLFLPNSIEDPLSFLLDLLSTTKSRQPSDASFWHVIRPILYKVLHELDHFFHHKFPLFHSHPERRFLICLTC